MMLSPHPMDHAQKRALQGTNGITGLGLRHIRLPSYTPACFWPDAPRPSSRNPAQNRIRRERVAPLVLPVRVDGVRLGRLDIRPSLCDLLRAAAIVQSFDGLTLCRG